MKIYEEFMNNQTYFGCNKSKNSLKEDRFILACSIKKPYHDIFLLFY